MSVHGKLTRVSMREMQEVSIVFGFVVFYS